MKSLKLALRCLTRPWLVLPGLSALSLVAIFSRHEILGCAIASLLAFLCYSLFFPVTFVDESKRDRLVASWLRAGATQHKKPDGTISLHLSGQFLEIAEWEAPRCHTPR